MLEFRHALMYIPKNGRSFKILNLMNFVRGNQMNVDEFIEYISGIEAPASVVNPYSGHHEEIDAFNGASAIRAEQLRSYLGHRLEHARIMLIAEAPGYQGARFSGIAMTCERTLLGLRENISTEDVLGGGNHPTRTSHLLACTNATQREHGFAEPTAAIVWRELAQRGLSRSVVLWNAFPFHPHRAGVELSNRKPSEQELAAHSQVLDRFRELFPRIEQIVAVGSTAHDLLNQKGLVAVHVRHPANGGAPQFREQINDVFDQYL